MTNGFGEEGDKGSYLHGSSSTEVPEKDFEIRRKEEKPVPKSPEELLSGIEGDERTKEAYNQFVSQEFGDNAGLQRWLFGANDSAKTRNEAAMYLRNTRLADIVLQNPETICTQANFSYEQYDSWMDTVQTGLGLNDEDDTDIDRIFAIQTRLQQYVYIRSKLWQPFEEEEEVVEEEETPRSVLRGRLATWVEDGVLPRSVLKNPRETSPTDPNLVVLSNWLLEGQEEMPIGNMEGFLRIYPDIPEFQWRQMLGNTPLDVQNPAEALIKDLPETHKGKLLFLKAMLAPQRPIE